MFFVYPNLSDNKSRIKKANFDSNQFMAVICTKAAVFILFAVRLILWFCEFIRLYLWAVVTEVYNKQLKRCRSKQNYFYKYFSISFFFHLFSWCYSKSRAEDLKVILMRNVALKTSVQECDATKASYRQYSWVHKNE